MDVVTASGMECTQVGGEGYLVSAWGEVDLYVAPELRAALLRAVAEEPEAVVVDLMAVTFIDSTALGALVAASRRAGPTQIAVACTNPEIVRTFRMTRIDQLLPVYPSVGAAFEGRGRAVA